MLNLGTHSQTRVALFDQVAGQLIHYYTNVDQFLNKNDALESSEHPTSINAIDLAHNSFK